MSLFIKSYTKEFARQLELLTLGAALTPSKITFDPLTSSISIPMTRKDYRTKRLLFGLGEGYELASPTRLESTLFVRDILDHQLNDQKWLPDISLLFGVKLTANEVYLCSVQESVGVLAFELRINVRSIDIELRDNE